MGKVVKKIMANMDNPLKVMILWHMHQPYYKNLLTERYVLPWVRLHATKDYYEMIRLAEKYPDLKLTFNYVPSLLDQLYDYGHNNAVDRHLELSLIPAAQLNDEEKVEILETFFYANWDNMIKPNQRSAQLLGKRGLHVSREEIIGSRLYHFSPQDFLDLQVWSNLVWFGYLARQEDELIKSLYQKGVSFTEAEKLKLLERQRELIRQVIPLHKKLQDEGRVEVSVTPMYHPILPLLCDTDVAKVAIPTIDLPRERFVHPEDAVNQIRRAVDSYQNYFGCQPRGMWPSEGSVSEEALTHIMEAGIKWVGADEEVLAHSLRLSSDNQHTDVDPRQDSKLYQIHSYAHEDQDLKIFFRDHTLSDLVGFTYSRWMPNDAAHNFIQTLGKIGAADLSKERNVVNIILDGENAWEYYHNNGYDFLSSLYQALTGDPGLQTVTPSQCLGDNMQSSRLPRIFPGSWIDHNFRIWIGHQEDNMSWDFLSRTRDYLIEHEHDSEVTPEMRQLAWESLFIAEGSDWNWWYGNDHFSGNDEAFDVLYRQHLKNVYQALKKDAPGYLDFPIIQPETSKPTLSPVGLIYPVIDGVITNYYEWIEGGIFECDKMGGAMHKVDTILKKVFYGFDHENIYLRLDTSIRMTSEWLANKSLRFTFFASSQVDICLTFPPDIQKEPFIKPAIVLSSSVSTDEQGLHEADIAAAVRDILEIKIPFANLLGDDKQYIEFAFKIKENGHQIERWPISDVVRCEVPSPEFEAEHWFV